MNRQFQVTKVFFLGLALSHLFFVFHLYISNSRFAQQLLEIQNSGFIIVPDQNILDEATHISTLFFGAVFFTVSIGVTVTVLALTVSLLQKKIVWGKKPFFIIVIVVWIYFLFKLNQHIFHLQLTLDFIIVPLVVFWLSKRLILTKKKSDVRWKNLFFLVPILILAFITFQNDNKDFFRDIRDTLFLSNSIGIAVNNFYYDNSLFPAEAVKNLQQKTIKSVYLDAIKDENLIEQLSAEFIKNDYFPVKNPLMVDWVVSNNNGLVFSRFGRSIQSFSYSDFFNSPVQRLKQLSDKADDSLFLRNFIYVSLLLGLPILLYVLFFTMVALFFRLFVSLHHSTLMASGICFCLGLFLLYSINTHKRVVVRSSNVRSVVRSDQMSERIAALQYISKQKDSFKLWNYQKSFQSHSIVERYWLANALGTVNTRFAYPILKQLLKDPHPNVACRALYAAGKSNDRRYITGILEKLKTSNNWYVQNHAYQALKGLGWTQNR